LFRNCVVWNDIGGSLGLMHECGAAIENVLFENCTVIHSTDNSSVCPVAGLKLTGPGPARNFRFENIVIGGKHLVPGDPRHKTNAWSCLVGSTARRRTSRPTPSALSCAAARAKRPPLS
jgi:hypothetical protein